MFENISKGEWKFLSIVWLVVAAIVFLPMVVGYFMTPSGSVFLFRRVFNWADYTVYFSQIDQAKHGIFFSKDLFTQEPQAIGLFNPFWFSVGLLARIFSLSSFIALQFASFLLIPIFLLSSYWLIAYFFEEKNKRKICFVFFIFASGLGGWISVVANKFFQFPSISILEASPFNILSGPPHFIASFTLMVLVFLFSLYALENNKLIYSFLAGICAFLLFSFHPYHAYTVFGVLLVFLAAELLIDRRTYLKHIGHYIILLIFSAPPIIYYLWVSLNISVRHQTFSQNINLTPALWIVLTDYSPLLILAVLGAVFILKNKNNSKRNLFLIIWAATQFCLIYLPVNTQEQIIEGLNMPITILAACGLFFLNDYLKDKPFYQKHYIAFIYLLIWIFLASNIVVFLNNFYFFENKLSVPAQAYFSKYDEYAMLWIKQNTPAQSVILSSYASGNILPVFSLRPVYYGHWGETTQSLEKRKILADFFGTENDQQRKEFLESSGINYLFWGPEEKKIAKNFNPDKENFLQKVYSNNTTAVYKVN